MRATQILAVLLAGSVFNLSMAATNASAPVAPSPIESSQIPTEQEKMGPKFIWGILINLVTNYALSAFSAWLKGKVADEFGVEKVNQVQQNSLMTLIVPLAQYALGLKSAGALENTTTQPPEVAFKVAGGQPNYQGLNVSILGFDHQDRFTGVRPMGADFVSGERIKLKVLPTFDGLLVIENITPQGQRKQIYPPNPSTVVALKQGVEVMVPLGRDEYFQFDDLVGDETLVLTVRDPRSLNGPASNAAANREDTPNGSNFVQETPPGTFPVISQSLRIRHTAAGAK